MSYTSEYAKVADNQYCPPKSLAVARETLSDKFSYLTDRLRAEIDRLDSTADRLFARPSCAESYDTASGPTPLPATAERLANLVERLGKLNEQMSEAA